MNSNTSTKTSYSRIAEKLRKIIKKYYPITLFREETHKFLPTCVIKTVQSHPESHFKKMQDELRAIGFEVNFYPLSEEEFDSFKIAEDFEPDTFYSITFIPKDFSQPASEKKRNTLIQIGLAIITVILVVFSGFFYVAYIEPYYGTLNQTQLGTALSIFFFCFGMLSIVVVHEFGHFIFSRYHEIDCSHPYLIPGPPPMGMFGAFVSIRDDPQTRNQKFDIATGGIVFGFIISLVLLLIGFYLSEFIDTETYISLRMAQSDRTYTEAAKFIRDGLNHYNLLFWGLRTLLFPATEYASYSGVYLPSDILVIHPLAYAGWIGLLLSGLNLIPISFFDGGHILKTIFPSKYTGLVGLIIGVVIILILDWELYFIALIGASSVCLQLGKKSKVSDVPNPTVKLKNFRKIIALCLVVLFIVLFPLSFDNLLYGFGG